MNVINSWGQSNIAIYTCSSEYLGSAAVLRGRRYKGCQRRFIAPRVHERNLKTASWIS